VIPILGIIVFVPGFLAAAGIKLFSFISPLSYPFNVAGVVAGVWVLAGIVYLLYLRAKAPQRILDTGRVFLEDEAQAPVGMSVTSGHRAALEVASSR
jgi:hypothetical protein